LWYEWDLLGTCSHVAWNWAAWSAGGTASAGAALLPQLAVGMSHVFHLWHCFILCLLAYGLKSEAKYGGWVIKAQ
jgi:hypothetical protein